MANHKPGCRLSAAERDYVRRSLHPFFSTCPLVADGIQLKRWRGGPKAGDPKIPPAAASMLDRGLLQLDTSGRLPRLMFTEAGLAELRAMMSDGRLADAQTFGHVRKELGLG